MRFSIRMRSARGSVEPSAGRQPAGALPPALPELHSTRRLLVQSWPGRLFIISAALKFLVALLRLAGELPAFVQILSSAATIGLAVSLAYFTWRLFWLMQRRLLWRVRRKLILSYIFIGVVPALLIIVFFLLGAWAISMNVSAYLFKAGFDDVAKNVALLTDAAAAEIGRSPATARETIERVQRNGSRSLHYRGLSMLFVPEPDAGLELLRAGSWEHIPAPEALPAWVKGRGDRWLGSVAVSHPDAPSGIELVARAVRAVRRGSTLLGFVVADVPIDGEVLDQLHEVTGVRAGAVDVSERDEGLLLSAIPRAGNNSANGTLFGSSVAFLDNVNWNSGKVGRATVSTTYRSADLYRRLAGAQQVQLKGGQSLGDAILFIIVVVAALFFIIEMVALVMGLALARSITSSIHQLFVGTERVRQGDFTTRINIATKDQLGELADSFNQMTGSIENLLQTAAEKKRLEEELRIARQIQMSLLPRGPVDVPGMAVTALCVPAREVGGDYYDFFRLGSGRVAVLIADVSGKGTSAALYMAELKGLVLSLSQIYQSPRQLLIEVNRIISENLDSRSFITMTYAVLDLAAGTMTYARAGHTPLIYFATHTPRRGAQVLTPNGMVLGLRIDGAAEKFAALLEEEQISLSTGDVIVLYTDGITEAMNADSDLFGESRLSRIVEEHGHLDSGELRERILREIEAFVGRADQHDDMTMILMKVERAVAARVAV